MSPPTAMLKLLLKESQASVRELEERVQALEAMLQRAVGETDGPDCCIWCGCHPQLPSDHQPGCWGVEARALLEGKEP